MTILHLQCLKDAPDRAVETGAMLRGLGIPADALRVVRAFDAPLAIDLLDGTAGLTIGGSGWSAFEDVPHFGTFADLLMEARRRRLPTFGICFGAQALAHVFGGTVVRDDPRAEYGTIEVSLLPAASSDRLFAGTPSRFRAQAWHHDRIAVLPNGAAPLGWNRDGAVLQAFAFADAPIWGVQFHPERTAEDFVRLLETRTPPDEGWPIARIRETLAPSPKAAALLARFAAICGASD